VVSSARDEVRRGVRAMLDRELATASVPGEAALVIGTADQVRRAFPSTAIPPMTRAGAYWIGGTTGGRRRAVVVAGHDARGVLYRGSALPRHLALRQTIHPLHC